MKGRYYENPVEHLQWSFSMIEVRMGSKYVSTSLRRNKYR